MTRVWGATSTTDEVLSGTDLHGKRILVTGVSAGIGVETARALAAHGAQVTGAARDLEKAEAATAQLLAPRERFSEHTCASFRETERACLALGGKGMQERLLFLPL